MTKEWRKRLMEKNHKKGQPPYRCYSRARYQIGKAFFCKRHAEMKALELLLNEKGPAAG